MIQYIRDLGDLRRLPKDSVVMWLRHKRVYDVYVKRTDINSADLKIWSTMFRDEPVSSRWIFGLVQEDLRANELYLIWPNVPMTDDHVGERLNVAEYKLNLLTSIVKEQQKERLA